MAKTRRVKKARRARRATKTRARRGGGESCYGNNSNGKHTTWSCSTACGEKETCEPVD